MTEQDRQLLLVELCSRLPYVVKVLIPECRQDAAILIGVDDTCFAVKYDKGIIYCPFSIDIKPYYRPMSSMTEEEKQRYNQFIYHLESNILPNYGGDFVFADEIHELQDWLNKKHFDYRGLIPKGLAISTEEFNPYKS